MQLKNNTERSCVSFTEFFPMVAFVEHYLLSVEQDIEINTVKILNNLITTRIPCVILYNYHPLSTPHGKQQSYFHFYTFVIT